eukprot:jgi/Bigna1/146631/aug1.118_g21339
MRRLFSSSLRSLARSSPFPSSGGRKRGLTPRKLEEIVKIPLLLMNEADKIVEIWTDYHSSKPGVFAGVLKGKRKFQVMMQRAQKSPLFIYPLVSPDGGGNYFVLVSQFQGKHCLFTSLEDFNEKKENAQPHLVITFYDELINEKDLVLIRTDICNPAFSLQAAKNINESVVKHYVSSDGYDLVDRFNHDPSKFDIESYLADPANQS